MKKWFNNKKTTEKDNWAWIKGDNGEWRLDDELKNWVQNKNVNDEQEKGKNGCKTRNDNLKD